MTEQAANLARVRDRIAGAVLAFCRECLESGCPRFHVAQLHAHVASALQVAPASADRVLRDLRQRGAVSYRVVSRRESLYEVLPQQPGLFDGPDEGG